jgi:NADH dehydrogenase
VGRIGRFKVRGFLAWWIWRTYYLLQMPRWNRRVRIIFDWTISLLFKNDIVELDVQNDPRPVRAITPPAAPPAHQSFPPAPVSAAAPVEARA